MSFGLFFDHWRRSPLAILTGILGVVYGVGFMMDGRAGVGGPLWQNVGAAILGLTFTASLAVAAMKVRTG